ncbi:MAG: hypothetical protein ABF296_07290 [Oceanococcaceae bacterium]
MTTDGPARAASDPPEDIRAGAPISAVPLAQGCGWFEVFREGTQYFALADTAARYWVALGPSAAPAGSRIRLQGTVSNARYFSLHVYDRALQSRDALADFEIDTRGGLGNPYRSEVRVDALRLGAPRFTAEVLLDAAAIPDSPNVLLMGETPAANGVPGAVLMYRAYVPAQVELPTLELVTPAGTSPLPAANSVDDCRRERDRLRAVYLDPPPTEPPRTPADTVPTFRVFRGALGQGEGLLINRHNAYLFALTERQPGRALIVRGRAPTFTDDGRLLGLLGDADMRFWSLCQNSLQATPVPGCVSDFNAQLDNAGFFTVVISDPADEPRALTTRRDVNWLPWGVDPRGFPAYRHLLPDPDFAHAVQRVAPGQSAAAVMQSYYPRASYCSTTQLNAAADQPLEEVFASCRQELARP